MRFFQLVFLIYSQLFFIVNVTAQECATVDLNAIENSPLRKIPVYDQDGVGICYAYTASQLIDYNRLKNGDKSYDLTNPVYASWSAYYKNKTFLKKSSLQEGGEISDVVNALNTSGVCSNKESIQSLARLSNSSKLTDIQVLYFLEMMHKHYSGFFSSNNFNMAKKDLDSYTRLTCKQVSVLRTQLEKLNLFGVAPTLVLENLFDQCKNIKLTLPKLNHYMIGSDERMQSILDGVLTTQQPAEIGLCSSMFKDTNFRGLKGLSPFMSRFFFINENDNCKKHSVLITGKAIIAGDCHYLVRNSWGSYWYPETATSCACILKNGQYKAQCKKGEGAQYVGCWFKQKDIIPNLGDINVFK